MLKRLELIGFKSFADRTVFDFSAGITAVVGPNGSGKSNVVDAVKWVLGEQSAKSLRGGEMADVIFNGSTSRKGLSYAEVSLTFDNSKSQLATPHAEVRITRCVDRTGTGEYFINGQPCRLKDIKDVFLGTGAGAHAYSIIEQGRVDALLQASQDDRRAIFEEAAGVSRFKYKKAESLRRLERVGQNLARLQDILGEVDQQLKSIRLQASKAQKYQEYSTRLRELRLKLGLRDYHLQQIKLNVVTNAIEQLRIEMAQSNAQSNEWHEQIQRLESALEQMETDVRGHERTLSETSSRIMGVHAAYDRDRALSEQLENELKRDRLRHDELQRQIGELERVVQSAKDDLAVAQWRRDERATDVATIQAQSHEVVRQLDELREQLESDQSQLGEQLRAQARWQNEAVTRAASLEQLRRERDRLVSRKSQSAQLLTSLTQEIDGYLVAEANLNARADALRRELADFRAERESILDDCQKLKKSLTEWQTESAAVKGQMELLEAMQSSREDVNAGIREVLAIIADPQQTTLLSRIAVGWLPDCLRVAREDAPYIDLALGPLAEAFIVRDAAALDRALPELAELGGRVDFITLDASAHLITKPECDDPRAINADRLVHCNREDLADLPRQLLSSTLVVDSLETARELSHSRPGCRFVTRQGEVLDANGALTIGADRAEAGVLSRTSELRDLHQIAVSLAHRIENAEVEFRQKSRKAENWANQIAGIRQEIEVLTEQQTDLKARKDQHRERQAAMDRDFDSVQQESMILESEVARLEQEWADANRQAEQAEVLADEMQACCDESEDSIQAAEDHRLQLEQRLTTLQIEQARCIERLTALQGRHELAVGDLASRRMECDQLAARLEEHEQKMANCQEAQLAAQIELTTLDEQRSTVQQQLNDSTTARAQLQAELREITSGMQSRRAIWQQQRDELHAKEIEANELRHRQETLVARLVEDYQLDLAAEYATVDPATIATDHDPAAEQQEAEELRKKLHRLGGVNLEALQELEQIEKKSGHLVTQFEDLTHARRSLEEIIQRINVDSKRLFLETLTHIKEHFQDLFRLLFGGGVADIVLANPDDPLESDIDILARPPGKELRSISLMSGGERTMTAVALLLAIFRSKPSPFCILDEVDAALDEANTSRLTTVLRDFANTAQFIVVTHAKRTMAAADMLYGVTMQESGISKRVAVRFEDWPDDQKMAA